MAMDNEIVLQRYYKVATALLEKDEGQPRIHRLRPICIVKTELNCIAKSRWSKKLMQHVDKHKLLTNDQYGGRNGRQAQSAVINKVLYYDIQNQIVEDAVFIDKDARSCFDRLLPKIVTLENEKVGMPKESSSFMENTLDNQEIHFRTMYGLSKGFIKKDVGTAKYGAGQGIGWSGQACNATLNIICNAMKIKCKGMMVFCNPDGSIRVETFGDYFVDDTELGTSEMGKDPNITIIQQAQLNDQKHSYYWFISGGRNAVEKGLWYHLSHKFVNGRPVQRKKNETKGELKTKPSYDEEEVVVPQYEVNQAHKMLGCWVCPALCQKKQKEVLISLCRKWSQKVVGKFLSATEKIQAYETVLLKQLEYRLAMSCLTITDCEEIMKYYMPQICHGYHIQRNFERDLCCATKKYGGLQVTHLYDLVGHQKMKFFMKHVRNDDKTGRLIKISMEYTQLQMGISKPFYTQKYDKWKTIVTNTWMTHLWQYMNEAEATLEVTEFKIPKKQRKNDRFLMDILSPHIPNKNMHYKINACRMALKVIFLSDITTLNGKEILPEVYEGRISRESTMKWPKQSIPNGWWKLWNTYITSYIVPLLKSKPLGKSLQYNHQRWVWMMSNDKNWISNGNEVYKRSSYKKLKKMKFRQCTGKPFTRGIKVDVDKQSNFLYVKLRTNLIPSQVLHRGNNAETVPDINNQKYQLCRRYKFLRKHEISSPKKRKKLEKAFAKGNLIAATDGSALRGDRSSMAYCLAKRNGKKLYSAYSPILCDRDYNSSDRAELMAILAVVSHLWILSTSLRKTKHRSSPVELFSDSMSSITSCEKDIFHSTKNVMSSNIDLKLEIRSILRKIKRPVIMTHVEAHQDEDVEYDDLPLPAQLNSDMNALASQQYRHKVNEHDELMPHLPAQKVSLVVHGNRLSHDIANEFIRVRRDYPGETAALRSWNINKKYGSLIDWTALESNSKKWKKREHGPAVKCIHRQWDTSARKKDWGQSKDDRCPICSNERETCDHVLQCEEKIIFEARKIFLRELKEELRSLGTKPILLRWLMILTYQFIGKFETKVPPKVNGYKKIRRAIQSQLKLGTGNMLRGIISFKWGEIQARQDKKSNRT